MAKTSSLSDASANQPINFAEAPLTSYVSRSTYSSFRARALQRSFKWKTKTIPIVIGRADENLVAAGLVDSLARPGGNITGSQLLNNDLIPKRLELLKALVPNLSKVALLREDVTTSVLEVTSVGV